MFELMKKIEDTRAELNELIISKKIITNDKELLELSVKLDKLIAEYYMCSK